MNIKHYDFAIFGNSLCAQIIATLLTKQGKRVIFFHDCFERPTYWLSNSLFLESFLALLGGLSCRVKQQPTQIITEKTRITLHHDRPLADELLREFGDPCQELHEWLNQLEFLGLLLEEVLWQNGGLPLNDVKSMAKYKLLCLRKGLKSSVFRTPLVDKINFFPKAQQDFLSGLFEGISMSDLSSLSVAHAALLWTQLIKPKGLNSLEFQRLLFKRFEQFRGRYIQIDEIKDLNMQNSRWVGGQLKGGEHFTARFFLIGDLSQADRFSPNPTVKDSTMKNGLWCVYDLEGGISRLLATRIICCGNRPLQLTINDDSPNVSGIIETFPERTKEEIRKELVSIFPFNRYKLSRIGSTYSLAAPRSLAKHHEFCRERIKSHSNLYWADEAALVPELGLSGATLLAWTLIEYFKKTPEGKKL